MLYYFLSMIWCTEHKWLQCQWSLLPIHEIEINGLKPQGSHDNNTHDGLITLSAKLWARTELFNYWSNYQSPLAARSILHWSSGAGVALAARQLFKYVSKVINQDADLIIQSSTATDPQCGLAGLVPARLNAVILYKFSSPRPRLRPRSSSCLPSEGDNSQHSTKSSITQFGQEDVSLACQTARVGVSTHFCFVLFNRDTNEHNAVKDVKHQWPMTQLSCRNTHFTYNIFPTT